MELGRVGADDVMPGREAETLTDTPSLYSELFFILLTLRILKVHLHTIPKCSSLLLFCDPTLGWPLATVFPQQLLLL